MIMKIKRKAMKSMKPWNKKSTEKMNTRTEHITRKETNKEC